MSAPKATNCFASAISTSRLKRRSPLPTYGCNCINDYGVPRALNSNFYLPQLSGSSANSNYNSLQTSWRIDNWHGLTSTMNYTWSHSIDDASDGEDYVPNASQPNDSQAPIGFNRGNSNFDVRQRFVWNFIYQIPDSPDSGIKWLRNGWGLNGIVTVQSGQPFHLNYNFEDDYDGSGEGFGRPDIVGAVHYNQNDPTHFLDLSSFAVPCTSHRRAAFRRLALPLPAFPALATSELSAGTPSSAPISANSISRSTRNTPSTERLNMELRFEAYNLFNHPNFANPYLPAFIADAAHQRHRPCHRPLLRVTTT